MEVLFNLSEQVIRTDPNEDSVPSSSSIKTSTNKSSSSSTTTTSIPTTTITTVSTSSSLSTKTDKPITTTTSIPAEHKFAVSNINHQTLAIFSQGKSIYLFSLNNSNQFFQTIKDENSKLALEGQVVQKGECRPIGDAHYMNLKKETIRRASQPTKIVQKLDRAINNFKPINVHRSEV